MGSRLEFRALPSRLAGRAMAVPRLSGVATAPGSYQTPNILNNASFTGGSWDGWQNFSAGTPTTVVLDGTVGYDDTWSVRRDIVPLPSGDVTAQFSYPLPNLDRIWFRCYFKLTCNVSSTWKWFRFVDSTWTTLCGGLWVTNGTSASGIIGCGFDTEDSAVVTTIGLTEAQVIDGNWHSIEMDYWRNGDPSGWPSAAFWFDNNPQSLADGTPVTFQGQSFQHAYWQGGRLYAGVRGSSVQMGHTETMATLNQGNTSTGSCWMDRISISSLGRIGP